MRERSEKPCEAFARLAQGGSKGVDTCLSIVLTSSKTGRHTYIFVKEYDDSYCLIE